MSEDFLPQQLDSVPAQVGAGRAARRRANKGLGFGSKSSANRSGANRSGAEQSSEHGKQKSGWNSYLAGLGGILLLVVLMGAGYLWAKNTVYTPAAAVKEHLELLAAGNLQEALELAPQQSGQQQAHILNNEATTAAKNKYQDIKITEVQESAKSATVKASVTQAGKMVELEYTVTKSRQKYALIFDTWHIAGFNYPVITMQVSGNTSLLAVNGAKQDLAANQQLPTAATDVAEVSLLVSPGEYTLEALSRTEFLSPVGAQVYNAAAAGSVEALQTEELQLELNAAGEAEVVRLAQEKIDACITQTVPVPEGCSFQAWTWGAYSDSSWQLVSYPELVIDKTKTTFAGGGPAGAGVAGAGIFNYTAGGVKQQREVAIYGDGYYNVLPNHKLEVFFNQ